MNILIQASKIIVSFLLIGFTILIVSTFIEPPENEDIDPTNIIQKALWTTNANEKEGSIYYTFIQEEDTIVGQVVNEQMVTDLKHIQSLNLWEKEEKPSQFVKTFIDMTKLLDVKFFMQYADGSPIFKIEGDEVMFFELLE